MVLASFLSLMALLTLLTYWPAIAPSYNLALGTWDTTIRVATDGLKIEQVRFEAPKSAAERRKLWIDTWAGRVDVDLVFASLSYKTERFGESSSYIFYRWFALKRQAVLWWFGACLLLVMVWLRRERRRASFWAALCVSLVAIALGLLLSRASASAYAISRHWIGALSDERAGGAGSVLGAGPWMYFCVGILFGLIAVLVDRALFRRHRYFAIGVLLSALALTDVMYKDAFLGCALGGIVAVILLHWFTWGSAAQGRCEPARDRPAEFD